MKAASAHRSIRIPGLIALILVAALAAVLGLWRPWAPPPIASPAGAGSDVVSVAPAALALPESPRVLVFGDSWTYGAAASAPTLGYAALLAELIGGETIVDGEPASGYLREGHFGNTFGARIAALDPGLSPDLVIVQGSINDRRLGTSGYREAVTDAWDALSALYPDAAIVVLGPAPHALPVAKGTARIDRDLGELAASRGWWYISPIEREWITEGNYLAVIDVDEGRRHPSDDGHRYLAEQVASALAELAAPAPAASAQ